MAAVVCVVRLETGEQKKVVLPTGSYDELVHALSTHTTVDEQTLLQVFDTKAEEYIDLEKDCTILSKSKIKAGRKVLPPTTDDNPELVVYNETAEGRRTHHEWLTENANTAGDEELRPRLLATAKERHERLEHMTIQQALLENPFLATEHSLQLEFDLLFKKKTSWTT
ncbi:hypothetical protein MRX96_037883 [Rhipicephalus microplus]